MAKQVTNTDSDTSFKQIDRLINFSDAVIAIAVTILILPLVDKAAGLQVDSFRMLISEVGQQFAIFLISFVVICRFWIVHHRLFHSLRAFNGTIFWLNALWLLSIVVIPFPTELLAKASSDNSFIPVLYIANLLVTTVTGLLIEFSIKKSPELQKPGTTPPWLTPAMTATAAVTGALILAIVFPAIGLWSLLLLFLIGPITATLKHSKS